MYFNHVSILEAQEYVVHHRAKAEKQRRLKRGRPDLTLVRTVNGISFWRRPLVKRAMRT